MLDWMFIMLLVICVLLTLMIIEFDYGIFWNSTLTMIGIVLWFVLAASIMQIEIPYQIYNSTSGNIETGYHMFTSPISPYLVYFFMLFGIIMMIYFLGYILVPIIMRNKWVR